MSIVMNDEHRKNALKMTRVGDQQPVEALGPNGPHESLRDAVRLRRLNRRAHDPNARAAKHLIEASREFAIPIPNQQANRFSVFGERPRDLTSFCPTDQPKAMNS
jgi:hypothetical protein